MSPRSPIFKTILWKAFSAGALVGVTIQSRRGALWAPSHYASIRFYFRTELNQLRFAAKLEELSPILSRDHSLGTAIGAKSGQLYFVDLPLSSTRLIRDRQLIALPLAGGLRGLKPIHAQLIQL